MLYIDVTRLYLNQRRDKRATGVDKVCLAYVKQFADVSCAVIRLSNQWLFFSKKRSVTIFSALMTNKSVKLPLKLLRGFYKKPLNEANFLLHTAHNGLEDPKFLDDMSRYGLKGIYFLHDLIPVEYPEYCQLGSERQHHQRLLVMSKAELVICNSRDVYKKFNAYCEKKQLIKPQIVWSHLGVDNNLKNALEMPILTDIAENLPFFMMIGTIEGRKNHWLMLNLWRDLVERFGENCPRLIIVGKRGWECEQVFAALDRSIYLRNFVIELNDCADSQLLYLLKRTRALLFPSNTEGFGLPLVEALLVNIPVIASDIAVFHEIGQDVVEFASPFDEGAWRQLIIDYMNEGSVRRAAQIQRIKDIQSNLPTWQKHFNVVAPHIYQVTRQ